MAAKEIKYGAKAREKMEVDLEEPYILLNEKKISVMKDLLPILEQVARGDGC